MIPFFSVVISLYNKESFIKDTIESVLNQSFQDFEIIIVNDGSTDNSLVIVNSFNDNRLKVISQTNAGASIARNNGIKAARAPLIALLDGDDLWEKSYLKTIYTAIRKYPKESIFSTAIAHKIESKLVRANYNLKNFQIGPLNFFKYSLKQSLISGSSVVFKKDILETTGWFDPDIKSGQDTDLWIRFGLHYPVVFINQILVYYVYSNTSLSNTSYDMSDKPNYLKYKTEEQTNSALKKYLDLNRYAMALKSKIYSDKVSYLFYKNTISKSNLAINKQILLTCPRWILLFLLKIKSLKKQKLYYKPL